MADTLRYSVIDQIRSKIKEIQGPTGNPAYECDLADRVYLGRTKFGDETPLPFVTLWEPFTEDGPEIVSSAGRVARPGGVGQKDAFTVRYYAQGFVEADKDDPTKPAYDLLGCLQRCLGPLSGQAKVFGATKIVIHPGMVRPAGGELSPNNPYCLVPLDITLTEERGNPYV